MILARPRRWRTFIAAAVCTAIALAILLRLGFWQLERKAWKDDTVATLKARLSAPPQPIPPRAAWDSLDQQQLEFRRASLTAEFMHDQEALVHAAASPLRPDVSGPGYWIFTPARLPGGSLVMVNRGFVPEGRQDPKTRAQGQTPGFVDIVGVMRWPEPRGTFTPADSPSGNLWFLRDHNAIAEAKKLSTVAPFYIEQEAPPAAGGWPKAGPTAVALPDNHLQYAITWFGLALTLVGVFAAWTLKWFRETRPVPLHREDPPL